MCIDELVPKSLVWWSEDRSNSSWRDCNVACLAFKIIWHSTQTMKFSSACSNTYPYPSSFTSVMSESAKFTSLFWELRATIASGRKFHGTTILSVGKILWINRSRNAVTSWMSTTRSGAMRNETRMYKSPRWRWRSINPFSWRSCFVAIRSIDRLWRVIRCFHLIGLSDNCIKFTPGPIYQGEWQRYRWL